MHIHIRLGSLGALVAVFVLGFSSVGCGGDGGGPAGGGGNGTIYYSNVDGEIWQLTLGDGQIKKLMLGNQPDRTAEGSFVYERNDLDESSDGVMVKTIVKLSDSPPGYNNSFSMPRVSPDGMRIAYQSLANDTYVVTRNGGQLVSSFPLNQSSTTGFERPSWTTDGRIVAAGAFSNPGLYISDAALSTFTRFDPMLSAPSQPSVSPDGKRVAFIVNEHVAVMNIDGTGFAQITTGNGSESFPSWSPDGTKIAAWNQYTLMVFNADGTGTAYDVVASHPEIFYNFLTDIPFCWR